MRFRNQVCGLIVALGLVVAVQPVVAQQDSDYASGVVTKVDQTAGKITIKHGPLEKFNMDGMTMVFRAEDPAVLAVVKPGDKIRFVPDRINGQFTATKIEKVE